MSFERRTITGSTEVSSSNPHTLYGYAARYGQMADIGDFMERISVGAFRSTIQRRDDIRLLRDHNPSLLLARTKSGTLEVEDDEDGLAFSADMPDTQLARETLELVKRQDLSGMSFGFVVGDGNDDWTNETDAETGKNYILRTIKNFEQLQDVSICSFPAYASTSVDARALVPEKIKLEARSRARAAGVTPGFVPRFTAYKPHVRLTDAEVIAAGREERESRNFEEWKNNLYGKGKY